MEKEGLRDSLCCNDTVVRGEELKTLCTAVNITGCKHLRQTASAACVFTFKCAAFAKRKLLMDRV